MNILIIQLRRIGDVIVTTPVIDALRAAHPEARIDFLVEGAAAPVLAKQPGLNEVLPFDKNEFWRWALRLRRRRYDWVLDFMNNPRTAQLTFLSGAKARVGFDVPGWGCVYTHRVARDTEPKYNVQGKFDLLRALGLNPPIAGVLPRVHVDDADFAGAGTWWAEHGLSSFASRVAVMPAHRRAIRRWPADKFKTVIRSLLESPGRAVLLFGGPGEEEFLAGFSALAPERVFVIPRGSLRQAASLLKRCQAAVTNDSGLMHLAVSVGTPTLTVYGPTWPENWNPRVPPHRYVVAHGLACLGCNRDVCPYHHECMEWVLPGRVAREAEAVLGKAEINADS